MMLKRNLIKAEIAVERIVQNDDLLIVGVIVNFGTIYIGDTFNYLYKIRNFELVEFDSGKVRTEMSRKREVALQVKSIEFRGSYLETISQGYSAQIKLDGIGKDLIEAPDDFLGIITSSS